MAKRLLDAAGLLATMGAAVLAIASLKELLDRFSTLPYSYKLMSIAGITAIALALLFVFFCLAYDLANRSGEKTLARYLVGKAKWNELEQYHRFCRSILGDQIATPMRLQSWYKKNPTVLSAVYFERRKRLRRVQDLVGVFSVFPITKEAKELLLANQLNGAQLQDRHVVSEGHRAAAFYIGAVGASGFRAKQQTLAALMGYVMSVAQKTPIVFTRPITPDGLRLVKNYGFRPVLESSLDSSEMIFVRNLSEQTSDL